VIDNLEVPLHKVATITMGTSPKGTTYNHEGIGLPLLNGPTEFGETHPHCTLYTTDSKKECKTGDLIFCVRASTGRMNWADRLYSLGRGVCSIRGETPLDTKFIRYCIEWKLNELLNLASGSIFSHLTKDTIRNFPIPYPESRHKIAAILSPYDDLIENNTRRIQILEEMAQIIYRQWFIEFQFPGHENVPMVESELGVIPQEWEVKELGEVVSEIIDYRGKTPKKLGGDWSESGIMALSAMNVKQGRLVNLEKAKFVSEELYKKWMKSEVEKNDILMTSEAPLGEAYCLAEKKKICLSQRLFCIRANPNIIKPSVLFYAIRSPAIQNQLHARATGTTVAGIRQSALRKISVLIPPLQLQSKAESVLGTLISTRETLDKKNINLRQTRDLLLPRLISGELDVSELNIDID
jgi:type I restriction enzyme S subunit